MIFGRVAHYTAPYITLYTWHFSAEPRSTPRPSDRLPFWQELRPMTAVPRILDEVVVAENRLWRDAAGLNLFPLLRGRTEVWTRIYCLGHVGWSAVRAGIVRQ